jgi:hypothetical protein
VRRYPTRGTTWSRRLSVVAAILLPIHDGQNDRVWQAPPPTAWSSCAFRRSRFGIGRGRTAAVPQNLDRRHSRKSNRPVPVLNARNAP